MPHIRSSSRLRSPKTPKDLRKGWLAELEVGDVVYFRQRDSYLSAGGVVQGSVARLTPTGQLVVRCAGQEVEHRFFPNGRLVGTYRKGLLEPTSEVLAEYARDRANRRLMKEVSRLSKALRALLPPRAPSLLGSPEELADLTKRLAALYEELVARGCPK